MVIVNKKKKALVTGGAGFIGSNLADELIAGGYDVVIIDNLSTGKRENINSKAKFHEGDIRNLDKIRPLFKNVDYVFHLAAFLNVQCSIEDPLTCNDININGTLNVLNCAKEAGVKKVIFASSASVYGNQKKVPFNEKNTRPDPISPYAMQKYFGENYCRIFSQIYGLPTVCLRFFNVFGPRQSMRGAYMLVTSIFFNQYLAGQPLTITGDGRQRRDFIGVGDVVKANILAAQSSAVGKGEIINIGWGKNYSVNQIAKMIGGPTIKILPRIEPRVTLADNTLAKKLLRWKPTLDLPDWINQYKKEIGL